MPPKVPISDKNKWLKVCSLIKKKTNNIHNAMSIIIISPHYDSKIPKNVTLVAVSKNKTSFDLMQTYTASQLVFFWKTKSRK
jgi:uncharacterized pyridoxal phosphate-containing UPF0001 family protein